MDPLILTSKIPISSFLFMKVFTLALSCSLKSGSVQNKLMKLHISHVTSDMNETLLCANHLDTITSSGMYNHWCNIENESVTHSDSLLPSQTKMLLAVFLDNLDVKRMYVRSTLCASLS